MSEPTNERPLGEGDEPVYEPAEGELDSALLDGEETDETEGDPGVPQRMVAPDPADDVEGDPPGGSAAHTRGADPAT